jgi:hypothetical protein
MTPHATPLAPLADGGTKAAKPVVLVLLGAYWPKHDVTGAKPEVGRGGPLGSNSAEASRGTGPTKDS